MTARIDYLDWHDTRLVVGGTVDDATAAAPVVALVGRSGELIAYAAGMLAPHTDAAGAATFFALIELEAGERGTAAALTLDGGPAIALDTVASAPGLARIVATGEQGASGWAVVSGGAVLRLVGAAGQDVASEVMPAPTPLAALAAFGATGFAAAQALGDVRVMLGEVMLAQTSAGDEPGDGATGASEGFEADGADPAAETEADAPSPDDAAVIGPDAPDWFGDADDELMGDDDAAPVTAHADAPDIFEDDAAPPAVPVRPAGYNGHFDLIEDGGWAAGWANPVAGAAKAELEILVDGVVVGSAVADQFREDLFASGFRDPNRAFWFGLPEECLDGDEHLVEIRFAGTDIALDGSPRFFTQALAVATPQDASDQYNIVPNANFLDWPTGLFARPRERFEEPVAGWFFDSRRGTSPVITLSVDKPGDLALRSDQYALRVTVEEGGTDGFIRLIVPLGAPAATLADYRLSMGVRRPPAAADDALHIAEVFLGTIAGSAVDRVATIRRGLRPRGTQRLSGMRVAADAKALAAIPAGASPALVFEFRGNGTLLLFSPEMTRGPSGGESMPDVSGEFEDGNIRDQVAQLVLSPIWQSRARAMPAIRGGAAPTAAALAPVDRPQVAMPFIPIVVPVYNAAADVEDLLRSIVAETDSPFEIVIFDDGSADYAASRIARWQAIDPRIRYFAQAENVGYTRNINIALQSTVSEFVVLINSDTIVTPGWLRKLYQTVTADDRTAAAGPLSNAASWQSVPRTKSAQGDWVVNAFPDTVPPAEVAAIVERLSDGSTPTFPLLNGFCTLFRRAALEEVGWFDDASFPKGYGEENDLCLRLGSAGWLLRVATDAYVHHSKSKSFGVAQRKELTKESNAVLRGKHPEVSFAEVEERMRISPGVNLVRQGLAHALGIEPVPHPPEDVAA